jgi:hypothetical protein
VEELGTRLHAKSRQVRTGRDANATIGVVEAEAIALEAVWRYVELFVTEAQRYSVIGTRSLVTRLFQHVHEIVRKVRTS